jgi:hypothetical protein
VKSILSAFEKYLPEIEVLMRARFQHDKKGAIEEFIRSARIFPSIMVS